MKLTRLWAVARKESLHIWRDPRSLGLAIAIPILMLVLFGYALALDVDDVPTVVWDQNRTVKSREFISQFSGSPYFSVRRYVTNYQEIERAIDRNEAIAAIVIPPDFAARVAANRPVPVQLILDGSDPTRGSLTLAYAEVVTQAYSQGITLRHLQRNGIPPLPAPFDIRPRVWYNPDMVSRNYIVPALIALIMAIIAALLTSLTVAREWETGTMEQLIATPVKVPELILGKLLPYFAIGMIDLALAVLMGQFLFHVPLRGSVALLFAMSALFLTGSLSLGMLISIATRNQLLANQLAIVLTYLPTFLLSGFVFPLASMPVVIQVASYALPARYFVTLLRGIYLKGVGLEILGMEALFLLIFGVIVLVIAHLMFKKKLA